MPSRSIPSRCESAALLLALVVALTGAPAAAQDTKEDREATKKARVHFKKGDEAFAAGRFEEAYKEFEAGYALVPKSAFLLNMAHSERKRGQVRNALALYRKFLVVDPQSKMRAEVESVVQELDQSLAAEDAARGTLQPPLPGGPPPPLQPPRESGLTAAAPDPQSNPALMGTPPPPVGNDDPPGLSARRDESPSDAPPFYKRWYFWAGAGAVVAAGVVTAIVLSSGGGSPSYVKDGSLGTLK